MRLLELKTFLHAALVARVEDHFLLAGNGVVALKGEVRVGIWYLLYRDDDLQGVSNNYRCAERATRNRSRSAGVLRLSNCAGSRPSSHVTSMYSTTSCATWLPASRDPTIVGSAVLRYAPQTGSNNPSCRGMAASQLRAAATAISATSCVT